MSSVYICIPFFRCFSKNGSRTKTRTFRFQNVLGRTKEGWPHSSRHVWFIQDWRTFFSIVFKSGSSPVLQLLVKTSFPCCTQLSSKLFGKAFKTASLGCIWPWCHAVLDFQISIHTPTQSKVAKQMSQFVPSLNHIALGPRSLFKHVQSKMLQGHWGSKTGPWHQWLSKSKHLFLLP